MRVKRGPKRKNRRKKILKLAKGYYGLKSRGHRVAREQVEKGLDYAYRDRKARKREFRRLWIVRINAAARLHDLSYSRLMSGLKKAGADIDRKALANIAVNDPTAFEAIATQAKKALDS